MQFKKKPNPIKPPQLINQDPKRTPYTYTCHACHQSFNTADFPATRIAIFQPLAPQTIAAEFCQSCTPLAILTVTTYLKPIHNNN